MRRLLSFSLLVWFSWGWFTSSYARQVGNPSEIKNQYAFVIGIDHYDDQRISNLASCRLDAVRFKSKLTHKTGMGIPRQNVRLLLDPAKDEIRESLADFLSQIKNPEVSSIYFYFSGHGVPGGIIPASYSEDDPLSFLSYSWLKKQFKKHGIANSIYVIDACYSGSILKAKTAASNRTAYISVVDKQKDLSTVIFTATNAYRVTPAGKHESVYSRYFLNALDNENSDRNKDGIVTAGELNEMLQYNLGDLIEPQFYGHEDFAIIQSNPLSTGITANRAMPAKTRRNSVNTLDNNSTASAVNQLVLWRSQIESRNMSAIGIDKEIDSLRNLGTASALAKIGFIYREGSGVPQDYNKALSYFISALDGGSGFAAYNLGYLYSNGFGLERNADKAIHYYKRAALLGDPYGQNNLGIAYSIKNHPSVDYNYKKAIYWLEQAANQGFVNAQSSLGIILKTRGQWTVNKKEKSKIFDQSLNWLTRAAEAGHGRAQFELGNMINLGLGVAQNKEVAKQWYIEACKSQELRACRKVMTLDYALSKE